MNLSKQPVVAYASRPWQGSSRGSSSQGDFYGSDTPEAIALCMNCTREDCTSSCWEIKEVLHLTRRRRRKSMRENLRAARKAKGMTQQAVADYLGISLRYYQRIETCESGGSFELWDALEDLLGVHQRILREIANKRPGLKESQ